MSIDSDPPSMGPTSHSAESNYFEERRAWMRFGREPGTDFASIVAPTRLSGRVEIADESLGGFGLVVSELTDIEIGMRLEIVYAGSVYRTRVCHITPRRDGRHIIGVSCD